MAVRFALCFKCAVKQPAFQRERHLNQISNKKKKEKVKTPTKTDPRNTTPTRSHFDLGIFGL